MESGQKIWSYGGFILGTVIVHCPIDFPWNSSPYRRVHMDIDIIFRIAGIGILISVLSIVLKQAQKEEQAEMLTLAGVVVVLIIVVQLMNQLFIVVRSVFNL